MSASDTMVKYKPGENKELDDGYAKYKKMRIW